MLTIDLIAHLILRDKDKAETEVSVTEAGDVVVAIRHPAVPRAVEPTTTTKDAERA